MDSPSCSSEDGYTIPDKKEEKEQYVEICWNSKQIKLKSGLC